MRLKEGSVVPINLHCGHRQVTVTLLQGTQQIRCPECGESTSVHININSEGEVSRLETC